LTSIKIASLPFNKKRASAEKRAIQAKEKREYANKAMHKETSGITLRYGLCDLQ
jgi:hypothetical protein